MGGGGGDVNYFCNNCVNDGHLYKWPPFCFFLVSNIPFLRAGILWYSTSKPNLALLPQNAISYNCLYRWIQAVCFVEKWANLYGEACTNLLNTRLLDEPVEQKYSCVFFYGHAEGDRLYQTLTQHVCITCTSYVCVT